MFGFKAAVLDADSLLYRVALKSQDKEGNQVRTIGESLEHYYELIDNILDTTKATEFEAYTGSVDDSFRHEIATIKPYKGNRNSDPPIILDELKKLLIKSEDLYNAPSGLEADDYVINRFMHFKEKYGEDEAVLCVVDKDAKQEPGHHFNYNTGDYSHLTPVESLRSFYTQLLIGDSTDNILGLYKVGKASALVKQLGELTTEQEMFDHVYKQYKCRFGNYADTFIIETFRLLYMCRTTDINEGAVKAMGLLGDIK